jgi:putative acetyltransferase
MTSTVGAAEAAPFALDGVGIRVTRPDAAPVRALLDELDAYLASLYAPEDNHILGIEALLAADVVFLGAWLGQTLLGCGAIRLMPGEPDTGGEPYAEIKRMMVRPAARGRRIGARLLAALEGAARERGLGLALLETGADQHEAVRLYERAGYALRGPFAGYPDNGLSRFYARRL